MIEYWMLKIDIFTCFWYYHILLKLEIKLKCQRKYEYSVSKFN